MAKFKIIFKKKLMNEIMKNIVELNEIPICSFLQERRYIFRPIRFRQLNEINGSYPNTGKMYLVLNYYDRSGYKYITFIKHYIINI